MRPLVPPHIASLAPYPPGKPIQEVERELGIEGAIKLASNENPLGPSPRALEAIAGAVSDLHYYPDGGGYYLKRALAERFDVDPSWLMIGNGSNELIELLVRTFMVPGMNAVSSAGAFVVYKLVTLGAGHGFRESPLSPERGFDLDALLAATDRDTRLVFIANPNNPTGTWLDGAALERFAAALDARFPTDPPILVLDEAYHEFVDRPAALDSLGLVRRRPRTVVLRTFSKAYGLAGLRCGYGFARPELTEAVHRIKAPFNVGSLALVAAEAALGDEEFLRRTVQLNANEMAYVTAGLRALGVGVTPSQTNFVLADFGRDAEALFRRAMARGVILRPMGAYGLPSCLRISLGTRPDNERMLAVMGDVMAESGAA
ncbi:MAG: histidinol-phosphate transaminase [Deltaproteobacteria bacterium]|nr:histidinol-phosphate transaminase [Deltaproteobacteria bacterium]